MKVLMVTPSFHPITGGTETIVMDLAKELNKSGLQVDVLTFNMDKKWRPKWRYKIEKNSGITVYKVPALDWLPLCHSPRLTMKLNVIPGRFRHILKGYDLIHFHEAEFSFPFFSFFINKPKILHLHGIKFDFFKRYHLSRFMLKNSADLFLSLTTTMTKELLLLGIPKEKIVLSPNFVDTAYFKPNQERKNNRILFVGRIVKRKGLHVLLKSLKTLKNPVELLIIGPKGWDPDYNQKILQMIEHENNNGKHVIKFLGCVDSSNLLNAYQSSSVFVSSSSFEPFGVVLLEAMACGTAVISTCTDGALDLIENGRNGMLIPMNDPIKLANSIDYLIGNEDVRKRLSETGRKLVNEKYSREVRTKGLCKLYKKIIS